MSHKRFWVDDWDKLLKTFSYCFRKLLIHKQRAGDIRATTFTILSQACIRGGPEFVAECLYLWSSCCCCCWKHDPSASPSWRTELARIAECIRKGQKKRWQNFVAEALAGCNCNNFCSFSSNARWPSGFDRFYQAQFRTRERLNFPKRPLLR